MSILFLILVNQTNACQHRVLPSHFLFKLQHWVMHHLPCIPSLGQIFNSSVFLQCEIFLNHITFFSPLFTRKSLPVILDFSMLPLALDKVPEGKGEGERGLKEEKEKENHWLEKKERTIIQMTEDNFHKQYIGRENTMKSTYFPNKTNANVG